MATALRAYMAKEISAFEFDDIIDDVRAKSEDQTIDIVFQMLWQLYDDTIDHDICASKDEWDFMNRVLLILDSDAGFLIDSENRHRGWRQYMAVGALAVYGVSVFLVGWGPQTIVLSIPFGFVSLFIAWSRARDEEADSRLMAMTPFNALTDIVAVRKSVPRFEKQSYPLALEDSRIHSRFFEMAMWPVSRAMWLVASPLVLLIQTAPDYDYTLSFDVPQSG